MLSSCPDETDIPPATFTALECPRPHRFGEVFCHPAGVVLNDCEKQREGDNTDRTDYLGWYKHQCARINTNCQGKEGCAKLTRGILCNAVRFLVLRGYSNKTVEFGGMLQTFDGFVDAVA